MRCLDPGTRCERKERPGDGIRLELGTQTGQAAGVGGGASGA